jgi:hypothetical protein
MTAVHKRTRQHECCCDNGNELTAIHQIQVASEDCDSLDPGSNLWLTIFSRKSGATAKRYDSPQPRSRILAFVIFSIRGPRWQAKSIHVDANTGGLGPDGWTWRTILGILTGDSGSISVPADL